MNISRCDQTKKVVFELSGRLDTLTSMMLQNSIIREFETASHVILDFKQISYISSIGLRALLSGEKVAKTKGLKQTLINVSENVMDMLRITGLNRVLTVE